MGWECEGEGVGPLFMHPCECSWCVCVCVPVGVKACGQLNLHSFLLQHQEGKAKRKGAKKDPGAPKRPLSAFMLWMQDHREEIKRDNPGAGVPDVGRIGGEMWRGLRDKSEWEERAAELKKKYEEDMAEYKASGGGGGKAAESAAKPKASAKPR